MQIPIHVEKYNGKIERPKVANRALSDAEVEVLLSSPGAEDVPREIRNSVVGSWDFAANILPNAASTTVLDTGPAPFTAFVSICRCAARRASIGPRIT